MHGSGVTLCWFIGGVYTDKISHIIMSHYCCNILCYYIPMRNLINLLSACSILSHFILLTFLHLLLTASEAFIRKWVQPFLPLQRFTIASLNAYTYSSSFITKPNYYQNVLWLSNVKCERSTNPTTQYTHGQKRKNRESHVSRVGFLTWSVPSTSFVM